VKGEVAGRKTSIVTQVRRADDVVELRDLEVTAGQSNVKGQVDIRSVGQRTRLSVNLTSPSLAIEDLPLLPAAAPATTPKPATGAQKGPSRYLFADDAVPFDVLRARDVDGEATIGRLALSAGRHIDGVRLRFVLRDGKLDVSSFQASVFGGSAAGTLTIDATRGRDPAMKLHVDGRDLDLAALLAAAGRPREVRGGKTQLAIDVVTRGDSPREWASAMTGTVRAVVGPATLVNTKVDPSVPIDRIVDAVNPFRNVDPTTDLKCAVIRLPLERGIARVAHDRKHRRERRVQPDIRFQRDAGSVRQASCRIRGMRREQEQRGDENDKHRGSTRVPSFHSVSSTPVLKVGATLSHSSYTKISHCRSISSLYHYIGVIVRSAA